MVNRVPERLSFTAANEALASFTVPLSDPVDRVEGFTEGVFEFGNGAVFASSEAVCDLG